MCYFYQKNQVVYSWWGACPDRWVEMENIVKELINEIPYPTPLHKVDFVAVRQGKEWFCKSWFYVISYWLCQWKRWPKTIAHPKRDCMNFQRKNVSFCGKIWTIDHGVFRQLLREGFSKKLSFSFLRRVASKGLFVSGTMGGSCAGNDALWHRRNRCVSGCIFWDPGTVQRVCCGRVCCNFRNCAL